MIQSHPVPGSIGRLCSWSGDPHGGTACIDLTGRRCCQKVARTEAFWMTVADHARESVKPDNPLNRALIVLSGMRLLQRRLTPLRIGAPRRDCVRTGAEVGDGKFAG